MANDWVFRQTTGPVGNRKDITLSGWSAPFGRPRKDPLFKEIIKSRVQVTNYPGSSGSTRHAFGINWESMELKGRWMTKAQLEMSAADFAEQWIAFVKDELPIQMSWGNIVSYQGYIEELELAYESPDEIAWRLKVQIDQRDDIAKNAPISGYTTKPLGPSPTDLAAFLGDRGFKPPAPLIPNLQPGFLDSLDLALGELSKPVAELNALGDELNDYTKAAFSTLQHARGTLSGLATAAVNMRDAIINAGIDEAILIRTAVADIQWVQYQANADNQAQMFLEQIGQADNAMAQAQTGTGTKFITARDNDTWESISIRATGSADQAATIRSINGARYGTKPTPGETYLVT